MRRRFLLILSVSLMCSLAHGQRIFPGAVGFGTESRGAYAGKTAPRILIVNTLKPGSVKTGSNSGSFEWCATRPFPRIVLFSVSGVIDYTKRKRAFISIRQPYMNVYGQTAPKNGITLLGVEVYTETHDLLFQHVKFRQSDKNPHRKVTRCVGVVSDSRNVVFDHCSFSFGNDEVFTVWMADRNITLSNSIVSFALHESHHIDEVGVHHPESHGFLVIVKAKSHVSLIGNFVGYGVYRLPASDVNREVILNNFHFAVGKRGIAGPNLSEGGSGRKSIIKGNVFIHGSRNPDWTGGSVIIKDNVSSDAQIWVEDNICNKKLHNRSKSDWDCVSNHSRCKMPSAPPFDMTPFPTIESSKTEAYVCKNAGAFCWDRDKIDKLAIGSARSRRVLVVNSPEPLPARAYNRGIHQGLKTKRGSMVNGYDFGAKNVRFTVNGKEIKLNSKASNVKQVLSMINSQMPKGYEAVKHWANKCSHIILRSKKTGSRASITIGGDASVFGIPNGTFRGEDGIGGYPSFSQRTHVLRIPSQPHADADGDGYTNLENWVHQIPTKKAKPKLRAHRY